MSQIPLLFGAKMTALFVRLMKARTVRPAGPGARVVPARPTSSP